jgi:two-component system response regulator AtoC
MTKTEAHSPSILVIDDQEGIRKSFSAILEKEGYEVDAVATGQEAIKRSKSRIYNLALVDLRLPDMDGIQLLTAMRDTSPKMVKIIVTGYPSMENAIEAVNRGADAYIVKPFTMETLLRTIEEHLRKQKEAVKYSEKKVKEFIETRAEEYESKATTKHRSKK